MVTQLSTLAAVLEGRADALRSTIEAIPLRDGSPFASVAGTHNGRWVVVTPRLIAPDTVLMCSATSIGRSSVARRLRACSVGPRCDLVPHGLARPSRPPIDGFRRIARCAVVATWDVPAAGSSAPRLARVERLVLRRASTPPLLTALPRGLVR
jgi:hypothetical protein